MSQYQQPPYQTTVMQPVVVQPVVPVVVPVVSGHTTGYNRGPAHIRNGAKLGPCTVNGGCICFMSIYGILMMSLWLFFTILFGWSGPMAIPALVMGGIGAPFAIISCYLCITSKKKYDKERSQENTAPCSEPFIDTASPVYVPVAPGGAPQYQFQQQSGGAPYYNPNSSSQPGGAQYPGAQYHQVPDKSFPPEYDQQPSYAPPSYSP